MKNCPFCAEQIQDAAIKCRHCGEFLDAAFRLQPQPLPWYFSTWFIVVAVLSVGPLALPLIWWRPRLSLGRKLTWTGAVLLLTWLLYLLSREALQMLQESLRLLEQM